MNRVEQSICRIREKLLNNEGFVTLGVGCVVRNEELAASLGWKCPNLLLTSSTVLSPQHLALDRIFLAEFCVFDKKGFEVFDLKLASEFCQTVSSRVLDDEDSKRPNDQLTVLSVEPLDKRGFLKRMVKKSSLQTTRPIGCFDFHHFHSELIAEGIFCNVIREFGSYTQEFESRTYKFTYNQENKEYCLEDFGNHYIELSIRSFPGDQQPLGGVIFSKQGLYLGCLGYAVGRIMPCFVPHLQEAESCEEKEEHEETASLGQHSDHQEVSSTDENENRELNEGKMSEEQDVEEEGASKTCHEEHEVSRENAGNPDAFMDQESQDNSHIDDSGMSDKEHPVGDLVSHEMSLREAVLDTETANDILDDSGNATLERNDSGLESVVLVDKDEDIENQDESTNEMSEILNNESGYPMNKEEINETQNTDIENVDRRITEEEDETFHSATDVSLIVETSDDEQHLVNFEKENTVCEPSDFAMTTDIGATESAYNDDIETKQAVGEGAGLQSEINPAKVEVIPVEHEQTEPSEDTLDKEVLHTDLNAINTEENVDEEVHVLPTDMDTVNTEDNVDEEVHVLPTDLDTVNTEDNVDEEVHVLPTDLDTVITEDNVDGKVERAEPICSTDDTEVVLDEEHVSSSEIETIECEPSDIDPHSSANQTEDYTLEQEQDNENIIWMEQDKVPNSDIVTEKELVLINTDTQANPDQAEQRSDDIEQLNTDETQAQVKPDASNPRQDSPVDKTLVMTDTCMDSDKDKPGNTLDKPEDIPDGAQTSTVTNVLKLKEDKKQLESELGEHLEPDALLSTKITNNPKVLDDLAQLLDTEYQHGYISCWHDLAELLAIPQEAYDHCLSFSKTSPTEDLMVFLSDTKPQLTIGDLKDSLVTLSRADVILILDRYIAKSIISNESVIVGIVERDDTDLLRELAFKLDRGHIKNWKALALQLDVPRRIFRNFGSHQRQNSALLVLKYLPIFDPDSTVQTLKEACEAISRFDVVKFLDASGIPGEEAIMDILEDTDIIDELTDMLNEEAMGPTWKDLAREIKIPEEKFPIFQPSAHNSPTKMLLRSIEQCEPDITVDEFILALVAMKRQDIVEMLGKYFKSSDIRSILEENNCLPPDSFA